MKTRHPRTVTVKQTVAVELEVSPESLAKFFCELDDEELAQFFIEAAKIAGQWEEPSWGADWQWHVVGRHLANCACSTDAAREMVATIARAANAEPEARAAE